MRVCGSPKLVAFQLAASQSIDDPNADNQKRLGEACRAWSIMSEHELMVLK
jgi:hypothetical protein